MREPSPRGGACIETSLTSNDLPPQVLNVLTYALYDLAHLAAEELTSTISKAQASRCCCCYCSCFCPVAVVVAVAVADVAAAVVAPLLSSLLLLLLVVLLVVLVVLSLLVLSVWSRSLLPSFVMLSCRLPSSCMRVGFTNSVDADPRNTEQRSKSFHTMSRVACTQTSRNWTKATPRATKQADIFCFSTLPLAGGAMAENIVPATWPKTRC